MNRSVKTLLYSLVLLAIAAGGWFAWQRGSASRQWEQLRPTTPALTGLSAPGLDDRLAACAARLGRWPVDRAALAEFTLLCHANGLLPEAMRGYQALMVVDPANARWPHSLAAILSGYGRMEEALPLLQQAAALAPREPILWHRLGEGRLKNNQTAEATAAFERMLALVPGNVHALFGLARCDLQAGRLTAARSRLQAAAAADPNFPGAQSLLATVYERLGNPEAAELARKRVTGDGHYTEAPDPLAVDLVTYGHNPYLLLVAASAEVADGRYEHSIRLLERALVLAPEDARIHRQLGRARAWLHDLPGARQAFERAVALAPTDEKMRSELISLLRQAQDPAALAAAIAQGVALMPDSASLRFEAGRQAAQAGRFDEAIDHFQFVARARPEESGAQCELATVYFNQGRTEAGVATLLEVLRTQPACQPALTLLVRFGLAHADPRTGRWLQQALAAGEATPTLTELRLAYQRRFGAMP
jgi:Flp pilus assembly protein TadD